MECGVRPKLEIRNSNLETRHGTSLSGGGQLPSQETLKTSACFDYFPFAVFEFVSDFEIRDSNFRRNWMFGMRRWAFGVPSLQFLNQAGSLST